MKNETQWIEINKDYFYHNLSSLSSLNKNLFCIIKGNAYGHGIIPIVTLLKQSPLCRAIGVALLDEALIVRKLRWTNDLFILLESYFSAEKIREIIRIGAIVTIKNFEELFIIHNIMKNHLKNLSIKIMLECETGLNRFGITSNDISKCKELIINTPNIVLHSIFSHCTESSLYNNESAKDQFSLFFNIFLSHFPSIPFHIFSTGESDNKENNGYIRCGSGCFGLTKSISHKTRLKEKGIILKQIIKWKTRIIELKKVSAGESIGYTHNYSAPCDMIIATIPVGYYDGFPAHISHMHYAKINGVIIKQWGVIGMNTITFDITPIKNVKLYDEIILCDDSSHINVDSIAECAKIKNIAFTTGLNSNIKRVIV